MKQNPVPNNMSDGHFSSLGDLTLSAANQTSTAVLFPYYLMFPTTWWGMNYYLHFRVQPVLLKIMLRIMLRRDGVGVFDLMFRQLLYLGET